MQTPVVTAIVGATAVGKTALALAWAQRHNAEIVSADSRQIYRGMDIGTAKPSPAELAAVPHHLIDVVDPDGDFSLADFQEQALAAITAIHARERAALVVGGTGQYLAALLEGWQIPRVPPQPALRAELEAFAAAHGAPALHARLHAVDPAAAASIDGSNIRRVIRALEVYTVTGVPISAQQSRQPPPFAVRTVWLDRPREQIYARVDARIAVMLEHGLLAEVARLRESGYGWELPAMSGLGYVQFRPYFDANAAVETCVERLRFDTHAFVRRQMNWFRRLPNLEVWTPDHAEWRALLG